MQETLEHEIGHRLGLSHVLDGEHLMYGDDGVDPDRYDDKRYSIPADAWHGNFIGQKELLGEMDAIELALYGWGEELDRLSAAIDQVEGSPYVVDNVIRSHGVYDDYGVLIGEHNGLAGATCWWASTTAALKRTRAIRTSRVPSGGGDPLVPARRRRLQAHRGAPRARPAAGLPTGTGESERSAAPGGAARAARRWGRHTCTGAPGPFSRPARRRKAGRSDCGPRAGSSRGFGVFADRFPAPTECLPPARPRTALQPEVAAARF